MNRFDIFPEIDKVYQRALLIQQRATEVPPQPDLVQEALDELLFVLEELRASQSELHRQNRELIATRFAADWERKRYQALFELAPDSYVVTDRQGNIFHANLAAEDLFSTSQEYLIDKPLRVLIHEQDRLAFQNRLVNLEPVNEWEVLLNPRNGETKAAAISCRKVGEEYEEDDSILWLFRDITHRQKISTS